MRRLRDLCALTLLAGALHGGQAAAQSLPQGFYLQELSTGWRNAVGTTFAADGTMFVWEKAGQVWTVDANGERSPVPVIDISNEVRDWRDYGLLGFALDPNFLTNGYIYLLYSVDAHHLFHFGTPEYNENTNDWDRDSQSRLTRYHCHFENGMWEAHLESRTVLLGDAVGTGFPLHHESHGPGAIVFGTDGSLLVSHGDGASFQVFDDGGDVDGSSNTALADGVITPAEDVGAFRAQLVDCLSGKILRLDPATGDGLPSNPFYDAAHPRSARSRVWAMGFRNPFRFGVRPGTGSLDPSLGNPGVLMIGDVGWNSWEELDIALTGGRNFGWPLYEGMEGVQGYMDISPFNQFAPNPLAGQNGCPPFFRFRDLLIQDTLNPSPSFPNPCNPAQQIPGTVNRFVHTRPSLDWYHSGGPSRCRTYSGNNPTITNIGAPGSPVQGPQFGGFAVVGGTFATSPNYPPAYQGAYFFSDYVAGWIRTARFDAQNNPIEVANFASNETAAFVHMSTNPVTGEVYYIRYDFSGVATIFRIGWGTVVPPIASATPTPPFGPGPLTVQFSSAGTVDPAGLALTYEWDFGDGTPHSPRPNPAHVYPSVDAAAVSAGGAIIARMFELIPPIPQGSGSLNPSIIRDGVTPPVGSADPALQYDTAHGGDQGALDWIGYVFPMNRTFRSVLFQEGINSSAGGWFVPSTLMVQVRSGGVWVDVPNVSVYPPYTGNNGVNYETFELTFTPVTGDAIRIVGQPGGTTGYISVAELRVTGAPTTPVTTARRHDVTLTVRNSGGGVDTAETTVWPDDAPPQVVITNPVDPGTYVLWEPTVLDLTADFSSAHFPNSQLSCAWQTIFHHNQHTHPEPFDHACDTTTLITPIGCGDEVYYYQVRLTVTDPLGLSATAASFVYPNCCITDWDNSQEVNSSDVSLFLNTWFEDLGSGALRTDIDESGEVNSNDVRLFLILWFIPCGG